MIGKAVPWDPAEYLLHKATLPTLGDIAALPNTLKQTQGGCQNEKTNNHGLNERREQNFKKRTKQNTDKKDTRAEFKTLVVRMLKKLRGRNELRTSMA